MIEFREVSLRYHSAAVAAVSNVSFAAHDGKLTVLLGPNGSGKSTLVRGILGRLVPEHGSIRIDGLSVAGMSQREVACKVAVASQREEPVFPMQVRDYVSMGRLPFQSPWRAATKSDRVLVGAALERASIVDLAERSTDELSGGEWQRVRIARALAQGCQSVVLDEPTTHLDIAHEMHVFELARELAGDGRTILLISHQINLSARYADHLVLLHRGSVAVSGSAAEVLRADLMERVYEWPMVTTRDPAVGAPALLPLRRK